MKWIKAHARRYETVKFYAWLNLNQLQRVSVPAAMELEDVFDIFRTLVSADKKIHM